MIRIAICDDDRKLARNLKQHLEQKSEQMQDIMLQIILYHSGENFLHDVENGVTFHIVFMDIQMEAMNGVAVGHQFRKCADRDDIIMIFISSHITYSEALLDIGNVRFVRKPFVKEKLDDAFNRAVSQVLKYKEKIPRLFYYRLSAEIFSVDVDKIAYLKNNRKIIELFVWNPSKKEINSLERFYSSIPEALDQLPKENFFQCERSHVVNLAYVQQVRSTYFSLVDVDNTHIPIGKTYRSKAKDLFFQHRGA